MAAAAEKAHHSCCCEMPQETATTPAENNKDKKPCPCEMGQAPRDCAVDVQFVPVAGQGSDCLPAPVSTDLPSWADLVPHRKAVFNDTGPSQRSRPLFQRHHAWLL